MIAASSPRPAMTRKTWRRGPALDPSPTCSPRWSLTGVQGQPAHVDVPVAAGHGDGHGPLEVVRRHLEVPGEEVASAPREQAHRDTGADHLLGDRAHRAVAAEGADDVDPLPERGPGLPESRVVLLGLEEERLGPPLPFTDSGDPALDVAPAVHLRGVEDHGEPLARRWGRLRVLAAEGRAGGAARTSAAAAGACGQEQPQADPGEEDRNGDARPPPPSVRHRVEGTAPGPAHRTCVVFGP